MIKYPLSHQRWAPKQELAFLLFCVFFNTPEYHSKVIKNTYLLATKPNRYVFGKIQFNPNFHPTEGAFFRLMLTN
jgi:hypothetical protein